MDSKILGSVNSVNVKFTCYKTVDDKPTCMLSQAHKCSFLGTRKFGQVSVCMMGKQLDLQEYETGFLKPHGHCLLHTMTEKNLQKT